MTEDVVDAYSILTWVMAWCHWAITWTSFDQDPSCHMASLSQNELNKAYPEIPQHTEEYSTINSLFMETFTIVMSRNCAFTSFAASIVLCYVMLCYVMLWECQILCMRTKLTEYNFLFMCSCMSLQYLPLADLTIHVHVFSFWLGDVKQQVVTWANINKESWRHMPSPGHNA